MKQKKIIKSIILAAIFGIVLFVAFLAYFSANWYIKVFGNTGFDSILSTLTAGIGGTGGDLMGNYLKAALVPSICITLVIVPILFALTKRKLMFYIGQKIKFCLYPFPRILSVLISLILSCTLVFNAADSVGLKEYIEVLKQRSTLFEKEYVDPSEVKIKFPKTKRNLIWIWLESMETSFFPTELGGGNDVNPIPELYELAKDNINFSHNDSVGGLYPLTGSTWTIGALVSQTAGVPLRVPLGFDGNSYGQDSFLPGVTSLTDVLKKAGYYQTLMVGSDAKYGGRRQYFEQHGLDKVYDYFLAEETGVIPKGHYVWWGLEDARLFSWAKEELVKISKQDKPFVFSMLTVDTHHVGGYICDLCKNDFDEQYENALACSSRQVSQFVDWIKQQDFYKNTTIVICGDHPTMDATYYSNNIDPEYTRTVYNCFINAKAKTVNEKKRVAATFDLFPTVLASIGCEIPGERLGLGTNLFSNKSTLSEQMGKDELNYEIKKNTTYYDKHFFTKEEK